jgi:hypothetical protein
MDVNTGITPMGFTMVKNETKLNKANWNRGDADIILLGGYTFSSDFIQTRQTGNRKFLQISYFQPLDQNLTHV